MTSPLNRITDLIANAKIREALQVYREAIPTHDTAEINQFTGLSQRFSSNDNSKYEGDISESDYRVEQTRIGKALLVFATAYFQSTLSKSHNSSPLDALIAKLPPLSNEADLEGLGVLQLVNCNRRDSVDKFNDAFDEKKVAKQPFQFYFLSGCPTEKPESLAERILYETIEYEAKELQNGVAYRFAESVFKRIEIENLPLSENGRLEVSKGKFKEYIQKRFKFGEKESFEQFVAKGIPLLSYSHVVTIFQITEAQWRDDKGEIQKFFEWLMAQFQMAHQKVPTFIFFFVSYFPNLHDNQKVKKRYAEIVSNIDQFCQTQNAVQLTNIAPFESLYLDSWLKKMKIGVNQAKQIIDELYKSLKPEDQLVVEDEDGEKQRGFHMKDVEPIQEKIVLQRRKKIMEQANEVLNY